MLISLGARPSLRLGRILSTVVEIGILTEVGRSLGLLFLLGVGIGQQLRLGLYLSHGEMTYDKKRISR